MGTVAPQRAANLRAEVQLTIGKMPGVMGFSIPAAAQASLKRKKVSASKKNCVIASSAPASNLRLSQSTLLCNDSDSGCGSG